MTLRRVTMLGSGTSSGVPVIGCTCPVCTSADPRNRRLRASVRLELAGGTVLVDTSPDLREQALRSGLDRLDAILFTHAHADHILGMDDLRRFNNAIGRGIPCWGDAETLGAVRRIFGYAKRPYDNPDRPSLSFELIDGPFVAAGMPVTPVPLRHGRRNILGFRIGPMAYCTDCSAIPETSEELLAGLDLLVLNALRYSPHPAHFNLEQALAAIERLAPRRALLTHIAHEIGHERTSSELPPHVQLAFDGLRVDLDWPRPQGR